MRRKLSYEKVYDEIKKRIKEGIWKPGDKISTVQQLSVELGVGVSSVREAVRILGKQNILKIEQGRGTFVRSDFEGSPAEILDSLEEASILQLTETRLLIEPELAALAAINATEEEVKSIVNSAEEMKMQISKGQDFFESDMRFHYLIAQASRNDVLFSIMNMLGDLLIISRRKTDNMTSQSSNFHQLIAHSIYSRNAEQARTLMTFHLENVIRELKKSENLQNNA